MRCYRHRPTHALLRARIPFSADSARNFDTLVLSTALYAYSASLRENLEQKQTSQLVSYSLL